MEYLKLFPNLQLKSKFILDVPAITNDNSDLCIPNPCGPFSECRNIRGIPSCTCLQNYIGSPPNCRPECTLNSECPSNQGCIQAKCRDPCPGSCGVSAQCNVVNHTPVCSCPEGYTGDAFQQCALNPVQERKI